MTESRAKFHKISNKNIHLKTNELKGYKFWTRIDVAVTPFFLYHNLFLKSNLSKSSANYFLLEMLHWIPLIHERWKRQAGYFSYLFILDLFWTGCQSIATSVTFSWPS